MALLCESPGACMPLTARAIPHGSQRVFVDVTVVIKGDYLSFKDGSCEDSCRCL